VLGGAGGGLATAGSDKVHRMQVHVRPPLPLSLEEEKRLCDECRELLMCRASRRITFLQFIEALWRIGRARWSVAGGISDAEVLARWTDSAVVGLSALGSQQAHGLLARVAAARYFG